MRDRMTCSAHRSTRLLLETWGGMIVFRMDGRRKVYRGRCPRCDRSFDVSATGVARNG